MEFKVMYDVEKPKKQAMKPQRPEFYAVLDFLKTNHKNIAFEYETADIAKSSRTALSITFGRHNLPVVVSKRDKTVYVSRIEDE